MLTNMDYTNNSENLEKIKQTVAAFEKLKKVTAQLFSKSCAAGWRQRNELINHVYSEYDNHEKLISSKAAWEELVFEHNVHKKLMDFMVEYKDLYGYFPDYKKFIFEFDDLINYSVKKEEFEIAAILKKWRDEFPNP